MYTADLSTWQGVPVVKLTGPTPDTLALVAPGAGANLFALRIGGRDLLRLPPDAETLERGGTGWGTPVLMPPSRINRGQFHFNGRHYQLEVNPHVGHHIHGFVLRRAWEVEELAATPESARVRLVFRAEQHPEVMAQFPHPFTLTVTYTLAGQTLRCDTDVTNAGETPMPFGLGFHPYFLAPAGSQFRLTAADLWEMVDLIPTGRFVGPEGSLDLRTWQDVHAVRRDHGYALTGTELDGWSEARVARLDANWQLVLRASPQFRHWVVYNGKSESDGFLCVEPYTCTGNAFNLPEVSGMAVVAPGACQHAGTWEIIVANRPSRENDNK